MRNIFAVVADRAGRGARDRRGADVQRHDGDAALGRPLSTRPDAHLRRLICPPRAMTRRRSMPPGMKQSLDKLRALPGVKHAELSTALALQRPRLAGRLPDRESPAGSGKISKRAAAAGERRILLRVPHSARSPDADSTQRRSSLAAGGCREPRICGALFPRRESDRAPHSHGAGAQCRHRG